MIKQMGGCTERVNVGMWHDSTKCEISKLTSFLVMWCLHHQFIPVLTFIHPNPTIEHILTQGFVSSSNLFVLNAFFAHTFDSRSIRDSVKGSHQWCHICPTFLFLSFRPWGLRASHQPDFQRVANSTLYKIPISSPLTAFILSSHFCFELKPFAFRLLTMFYHL